VLALLCVLAALSLAAQPAKYDRARQLLAAGSASEAAAIFRTLVRENPRDAGLLLSLAIAEYKAEQFREAAKSAAGALRLRPDLLPASLFLGASKLELGEFGEAVRHLERVVAANPRERNGRLLLGQALLGAGNASGAAEHFRAASEMLPDNPKVWAGLARACEASGQMDCAAEAWGRLMALPPSVESHVHLAEVNDADQRWREAALQWREALKLEPKNHRVRLGLAWAAFRSRDYDGAMLALQPVLEDSTGGEALFLYGASLLNLQEPAAALTYLREAVARDERLMPARAALGQALLQVGKPEEAIPLLKTALPADHDGTTHFQLFRAYQLTGRKKEAQEVFGAYQRIRSSLAAH
jgi:predicted Zn-dependent protease